MISVHTTPQGYEMAIEIHRDSHELVFRDGTQSVVYGPTRVEGSVKGYRREGVKRLFVVGKPFNIFLFDNRLYGPIILTQVYELREQAYFRSVGPIKAGITESI